MNVTYVRFINALSCIIRFLYNVQSQLDETQSLQEDELDEELYESDDQCSKQNSTPKRQLNR